MKKINNIVIKLCITKYFYYKYYKNKFNDPTTDVNPRPLTI